jgi:arginyl-tRNA synthetase
MGDLRTALRPRFESALREAFGDAFAHTDPVLHRSEHADFQADVAMGLAKKVGKSPREVAALLVEKLDLSELCTHVEIKGPGFINLTLSPHFLEREIAAVLQDENVGVTACAAPETVVIDYSGPNVAKEMHVGHIRSTVIGDCLSRVLEALGHRVIRQNHLGDWGTQFGMLIEHMLDVGEEATAASIADLDAFYKQARAKFDGDPAFAERARLRVVELQSGDEATLARWRTLTQASRNYFATVYEKLGVKLRDEDVCGESFYNPLLHGIVTELKAKGLASESDGAMCAFPVGFKTREGAPLPLIIKKRDGGFGYAATDLAALRERTQTKKATRLLYVIGAPQQQHLAMVFAVGTSAGWLAAPARAEHVAFGSILGPDKKPFKTREGETVKLASLLDEAVRRAGSAVASKNPSLDEASQARVARQIGIGAIKYVDLSSDRVKDYVFDWDRMLAFEGNTAPYIQYVHARVQSIFRRAESEDVAASKTAQLRLVEPSERALALELLGLSDAIESVADTLQPHRLCTYLFAVATRFNTFYDQCPVRQTEDVDLRRSRLALLSVTARVLAKGLDLLGIEAPEQM